MPGAGVYQHDVFQSLRSADFVMHELTIADRANVRITTADGNLAIEQI